MPDYLRREGGKWGVGDVGVCSEARADPAPGSSRVAMSLVRACLLVCSMFVHFGTLDNIRVRPLG